MHGPWALFLVVILSWVKAHDRDTFCNSNPCLHGGECKNGAGSYSCNCTPQWTGRNCEEDVDECTSSPCMNMGLCVDKEEGFFCNCPQQWSGPTCERPSQCGPLEYSGWPSIELSVISGPAYSPANFTDEILPYICTYTITNLEEGGRVRLTFDDFLMFGSRTKFGCLWIYKSNRLEIFDGASTDPILDQCFAANMRPDAIISKGNSLRIEFKHWQSISYQFPVFRAHYRFLSSNEPISKTIVDTIHFFEDHTSQFSTTLWQPDAHDILWLFVAPKKKRVYLSLNPIYISKDVDIVLDIHDGITSYMPKIVSLHYRYHFPVLRITSDSNGLYMRCRTGRLFGQNVTVAGVFVFFSEVETSEQCSDFWCANKRCISSYFECDLINHCGDNSDEKPCLGLCPDNWCANGGECHQVTAGYPRCVCKPNFAGDRCQNEEVCPRDYCLNGGLCLGHSMSTRYCHCKPPYSGVQCQQDNSGCPQYYCQNGGSCEGTHDRYHCNCLPDFTGMYCEMNYVETYDEGTYHNSLTYTLITVIPGSLLLATFWVCCRMRRCRNLFYPHRSPETYNYRLRESVSVATEHASSVSRSVSRVSAGSIYPDEPPPYNVVVRSHQRRKLHRHHSHPGPSQARGEEPPPSYESILVALNRGQQTDPPPYIGVLQTRGGRRRSLDLSQSGIEMQETRLPLLERRPSAAAAAAADRGEGSRGQGSTEDQQAPGRSGGGDGEDRQERNSLLSNSESDFNAANSL